MKLAITLIIIAFLVFAVWALHAQTNEGWTLGSGTPPPHAWKLKTANDAATFISDFGIEVTGKEILAVIGMGSAILGGSRFLRKIVPDKWQANKLGLALAHLAGEINPTIAKLRAAADSPQGQTVEALVEKAVASRLDAPKVTATTTGPKFP